MNNIFKDSIIKLSALFISLLITFSVFSLVSKGDLEAGGSRSLPDGGYFSKNFPNYPGTVVFPMGSRMEINEDPIDLGYFETKDSPKKIANYFEGVWRSKGYEPIINNNHNMQVSVGVIDHKKDAHFLATFLRNSGSTWAFLSVSPIHGSSSRPLKKAKQNPNPLEFLAQKPDHRPLITKDFQYGRVLTSYSFLLKGSQEDNQGQVLSLFQNQGFSSKEILLKPQPNTPQSKGKAWEFEKDGDECRVHLLEDFSGLFVDPKQNSKIKAGYLVAHCNFKEHKKDSDK